MSGEMWYGDETEPWSDEDADWRWRGPEERERWFEEELDAIPGVTSEPFTQPRRIDGAELQALIDQEPEQTMMSLQLLFLQAPTRDWSQGHYGMTEPGRNLWNANWYDHTVGSRGHARSLGGDDVARWREIMASMRAVGAEEWAVILEDAMAIVDWSPNTAIEVFDDPRPFYSELQIQRLFLCDARLAESRERVAPRVKRYIEEHLSLLSLDLM